MRVWIITFDLEGDLVGGTPYMLFNGPAFHYTNKTCLKTLGRVGYEWAEKEMGRFAEDMS